MKCYMHVIGRTFLDEALGLVNNLTETLFFDKIKI